VAVKTWTGISTARRSRECDPRRRLLPALARRGGWRWTQTSSALVELQDIESLQKKIGRRVWEMRWEEGKRLREERGYAAHRRRAGAIDSDGEILELRCISGGEGKRGEEGVRGAFYRRPCMEEGLGFLARGARSTARRKLCSGGAPARGGRRPRQVGHPCRCLAWRRPVPFPYGWILGWFCGRAEWRPLGLFSISLILFPFSFSDSCFIS
jgi:hypothetical protein